MELDVPHPLTTNAGIRYFDMALVTNLSLKTLSLELAATALITLRWTKDNLAEQPMRLWFTTAIIKGLGLGYLSMRPAAYFLR
jgi:hypothetical protein